MFSRKTVFTAVALLCSTASAAPAPRPAADNAAAPNLANIKQPPNSLPPPTGLQLKFIGLGVGTQNYTCANSTAIPGTTGAVGKHFYPSRHMFSRSQPCPATLYDIGTALNADALRDAKLPELSGLALVLSAFPAPLVAAAAADSTLLDLYLATQGYARVLGDHFFTALPALVPTFALSDVPTQPFPQVNGHKNASLNAPQGAFAGLSAEGAVPWLQLTDNGGSQGGVSVVYRLHTAGGQPPANCTGRPSAFEVPYVAQYWVYGPPC